MHVLVTGASGFAGKYVVRELLAHGHRVSGLDAHVDQWHPDVPIRMVDVTDALQLETTIAELKPEGCIHLAGMAFVPRAWEAPELAVKVNVGGVIHLMEAFRKHKPDARIVVVSSSEVYGRRNREGTIDEDCALEPSNLYGVTKAAADQGARAYATHYGMQVCTARPQNHIGVGQSDQFVVSSFASQLADFAQGRTSGDMRVGNLDSERDFTDAHDVARAYRLLMESGEAGEAYNIASGRNVKIQVILESFCVIAGVSPSIRIDKALFRPTDRPALLNVQKIQASTGWQPTVPLEQSLKDIYRDIAERRGGEHA
jgi:GDP-4-dehydro-6-deoxy-D-mannose reductase